MATTPNRKSPIAPPLLMAFLVAATILGTITIAVPEVEAELNDVRPTGTIMVTTEPDFAIQDYLPQSTTGSIYYPWHGQPPGPGATAPQSTTNPIPNYPRNPATVYAKPLPAGEPDCPQCYQRTIRLAFGSTAPAPEQLDFVFHIRDETAYPPCNLDADGFDAAMDPCTEKARIAWRPDYSFATRPGWTVADNAVNREALRSKWNVDQLKAEDTDQPALILSFIKDDPVNDPERLPSKLAGSSGGACTASSPLCNALELVIAFQIYGTPTGDDGMDAFPQTPPDEFHVQINRYPSDTASAFETTCNAYNRKTDPAVATPTDPASSPASQRSAFTCVFTNPPFAGPTATNPPPNAMRPDFPTGYPTGGCDLPGGPRCNGSPSLVIRMDNTPPKVLPPLGGSARWGPDGPPPDGGELMGPTPCVCSFVAYDTDHNGHLDRFSVSFTEPMNPQSVDFRDFTIATKGRDRAYTITNGYFEPWNPATDPSGQCITGTRDATSSAAMVVFKSPGSTCKYVFQVAEMPFYDTGDKATLEYDGITATDRAGNRLARISGTAVVAVDRAPPILMAAYGLDAAHNGGVRDAGTRMHLFFSEDVMGSGTVLNDPDEGFIPGPVQVSDLCYQDGRDDAGAPFNDAGNVIGADLAGCFPLNRAYDSSSGICQPTTPGPVGPCRYFDFIEHKAPSLGSPVGTAQGSWKMVAFTMANPLDTSNRLAFGARDVHPFHGDLVGPARPAGFGAAPGMSRGCVAGNLLQEEGPDWNDPDVTKRYPCDAFVRDLSDNGAWYPNTNSDRTKWRHPEGGAMTHVTFPMVKSASVDVSNPSCPGILPGQGPTVVDLDDTDACKYWLKLVFNGPVRGPKGPSGCDTTTGSSSKGKPFFACNVDIATASGEGQGPQGFLGPAPPTTSSSSSAQAPYYLVADSDTAILQMDHAARPVDVSQNPSRVKIHCNTIYATSGRGTDDGGWSLWPLTQAVGAIPCDDPDLYYGPGEDFNGVVKKADVDIVDITPPRIIAAKTVDADHNGYLDGVELTFSEPVDDGTFCGGETALAPPEYCQDTEGGNGFFTFSRWDSKERIRAQVDVHQEECRVGPAEPAQNPPVPPAPNPLAIPFSPAKLQTGFRWDTGVLQNDNTGYINRVSVELVGGVYVTRIADCEEYFRGFWTNVRWPTDSLLHMTVQSPGMFKDLASHPYHDNSDLWTSETTGGAPNPAYLVENPNSLPAQCQYESRAFVSAGYGNDLANHPSVMSTFCHHRNVGVQTIRMTDGAPPVLWRAVTYDTPVFDANGVRQTAKFLKMNRHGDGTIDGYRLFFSEPVSDGSFKASDWHIEGFEKVTVTSPCGSATPVTYTSHNVTKDPLLPGNPSMRTYDTHLLSPAFDTELDEQRLSINDDEFILLFTPAKVLVEKPGGCQELNMAHNTEALPELTGSGSGGRLALSDRVGNRMVDFDQFAVEEEDGAGPQVWRIEGFAGSQQIKMHFSEPVDDGNHNGLVRDDFQYFDKNVKDVAGLSSTTPVEHQAGDRMATLYMGGSFTVSDQTDDKVSVRFCKVLEVAPSLPTSARQCVPNYPRALVQENDTTPPAGITDFRVVPELSRANSLTATWTAPGDDGVAGSAVSGYECVVGLKPLVGNETNPTGVAAPKFDPPGLAAPGRTQTMTIAGLQSEKTYYVGCFAQDELGNLSPFSNVDSGKTTRDTTPPSGVLTIKSPSHPGGNGTLHVAAFTWDDLSASEKESTVVYHYALNDQPNYIVLATDGSTQNTQVANLEVDDGVHYFHVAAFSAGGSTLTSHFRFVVGVPPLDVAELAKANDLVVTKPIRQVVQLRGEDVIVNNVTWTLPDKDMDPYLEITGIEIWRNDAGVFRQINPVGCDLTGTYEQLKTGYCHDITPGATADSRYKVTMVFAAAPHRQGDPVAGYTALVDETPTPVAPWIWVLAGIGLALLLSGLVIFFILRSRQKQEAHGGVAYSWESANPEMIGIDEATGLPVHEVRCPSCNNPFQAVGALPLPVTCPTCGTTGQLD